MFKTVIIYFGKKYNYGLRQFWYSEANFVSQILFSFFFFFLINSFYLLFIYCLLPAFLYLKNTIFALQLFMLSFPETYHVVQVAELKKNKKSALRSRWLNIWRNVGMQQCSTKIT